MAVRKRNGKYMYDFRINGSRYRKGGFSTKSEAKLAENERLHDLRKGVDNEGNVPFVHYYEKYVEINIRPNVGDKTYSDYLRAGRKYKDAFGLKDIKDISRSDFQAFINKYKKELGKDQLSRLKSYASTCYEYALDERLVHYNPLRNVNTDSEKKGKTADMKFIGYEDYKKLKAYLIEDLHRYYRSTTMFLLIMLDTGGRYSDVVNMTYDHINEVKQELFLDGYKNESAPRHVAVNLSLLKLIREYRRYHPQNINGYLMTYRGKRLSNEGVNKALRKALDDLGITPVITSHGLRHTFVSVLLYKGVQLRYISEYLGHSSFETTDYVYGHMVPELKEDETKKALKAIEI